ncbi:hypothetical protein [Acididesulfobacillus acetoxydans]|uniref:hypothetical protein n=1 Tax=Acididesulfobacillus acetoxydans TaxID=1561005 RepID=UPI001F0FE014|nr:hypothetical protein [Acididesulfobacillus acetoxydans]
MEDLFEKLRGYLRMESELPVADFAAYYQELIEYLNRSFDNMDKEERLKARYICSIVQANADARAKTSKATAKTFRKISRKCAFWADAIDFRLQKEGVGRAQIDEAMEQLNQSM